MPMTLKLEPASDDIAATVSRMHAAVASQVFGAPAAPRACSIHESDGSVGARVWLLGDGEIAISTATAERAARGDLDAVADIAHAVFHACGAGPSFVDRAAQIVEEAITDMLAQAHLAAFAEAFGAPAPAGLAIDRPVVASFAAARLVRIARWLENLPDDAPEVAVQAAAVSLCLALKVAPDRFAALAGMGSQKLPAETYRGYFGAPIKSPAEAVLFDPRATGKQVGEAIAAAPASDRAALARGLDFSTLLWDARQREIAA